MPTQILLGTRNPAKIEMFRHALDRLAAETGRAVQAFTLDDLGIDLDVVEDGRTTEENAEKKARAYFARARIPVLSIDGGLHVDRFPPERQPGVFVRRVRGASGDASDEDVLAYYTHALDEAGGECLGTWTGTIVLVVSDDAMVVETFSFDTVMTSRRKGPATPGLALDALMVDPASGKYYSEMTVAERPPIAWIYEFVRRHLNAS